ncbi:hypothetical protein SAMN02746093_02829 [Legionella quinlivanii DSM 21216]|nr:hypothetical protein SAMN02746093_02829 [Legionella quinlivanii DSM 21216]
MTIPYKLVDLTHPLTASTPSWDNSCGFNHTTLLDHLLIRQVLQLISQPH